MDFRGKDERFRTGEALPEPTRPARLPAQTDRPSGRRPGSRRNSVGRLIEEFREERQQFLESLQQVRERLDHDAAGKVQTLALDPMPVMEGIRRISDGQEELSTRLHSLGGLLQRTGQTDEQLVKVMTQVDQTLTGVQSTQVETVGALVNVGEKLDYATYRFDDIFERMSKAEQGMAEDYRKLQHRTLYAIAMISAAVILILALFMTAPWA